MDHRISAIILAAGLSSRMGKFKPLLPLGDTTVLGRSISLFRDAGIEDVRVVVGHRHAEMIPAVEKHGATAVVNPNYEKGMFFSVISGLTSLEADAEAAFVLPVDIPLVRPSTIGDLAETYSQNKGKIIRPVYGSRQGHPPVIPACLFAPIITWAGGDGLRGVLAQFAGDTLRIEVPDENILLDIDTPEDYTELRSRF